MGIPDDGMKNVLSATGKEVKKPESTLYMPRKGTARCFPGSVCCGLFQKPETLCKGRLANENCHSAFQSSKCRKAFRLLSEHGEIWGFR